MYAIASCALLVALGFFAFNIFKPTIVVFRSRIAAALGLLASLTFGVVYVDSLRTPEDDAKLAAIDAKGRGTWDDVQAKPETYLTMDEKYHRDGSALSFSGTISNSSAYAIKNVKLKCRVIAETDSVLWKGEKTVFKIVPAKGSIRFGPLSLTHLDEQAGGVGCRIVDATIAQGAS